jgi:glycosyltransferase involved in cell wall biosynthesis
MNKLLTIGMATYDDFHGVYFSLQALRMFHPICSTDEVEFVVIDNNPEGSHGKEVKNLVTGWVGHGAKYIPYVNKHSTAVRNEIFKNASGKYTISIDCHVLIASGGIESLLNYYSTQPDCKDIVQGPLWYDDLRNFSTEFSPVWRDSMYGTWDTNHDGYNSGQPFEIPMMGLGLFSCETKNWPEFNPLFKGFGGEEGYIHEKFRQRGGRAICIPQLKWVHRFGRPDGVKYPLKLEDRVWNYFVGWLELTKDPNHEMVRGAYEHFKPKIPATIDPLFEEAKKASGF